MVRRLRSDLSGTGFAPVERHLQLARFSAPDDAGSRASHDAQIFTNNFAELAPQLSADISKTSALKVAQSAAAVQGIGMG